jgi:hypothetical protein
LFRFGADPKYRRVFDSLAWMLFRILIANILLFVTSLYFAQPVCVALAMGLNFAVFTAFGDYCRARMSETKVFSLLMVPGVSMIAMFSASLLIGFHFEFVDLALVEFGLHLLIALVIYRRYLNAGRENMSAVAAIRRIATPWKRISLPNWPSSLIWYAYFNAPQILGYYISSQVSAYNRQAIVFRMIVALSTFCSTVVVASQKRVVSQYERRDKNYHHEKCAFLYYILPGSLLLVVVMSGLSMLTETVWRLNLALPLVLDILWSFKIYLLVLFWLFMNVYYVSNFFLAEKAMGIMFPSMLAGFVVYLTVLWACYASGGGGAGLFMLPLSVSIGTTLAIRFIWLLRQDKRSSALHAETPRSGTSPLV